jgi:hypothetical protein
VSRLSVLSKRDSKTGKLESYESEASVKRIQSFYEHFVEFTHVYWFDEVSPQEQGLELFAMWQTHLRSKELYDEVRQEIRDLVDYATLLGDQKQSENTLRLTRTAGWLGGVGVFAGLMGMNNLPYDKGYLDPEKVGMPSLAQFSYPGVFLAVVSTVALFATTWKGGLRSTACHLAPKLCELASKLFRKSTLRNTK